jgi:hypothetical protein
VFLNEIQSSELQLVLHHWLEQVKRVLAHNGDDKVFINVRSYHGWYYFFSVQKYGHDILRSVFTASINYAPEAVDPIAKNDFDHFN